MQAPFIDLLNAFTAHISTVMLLNGLSMFLPSVIHKAPLTEQQRKYGDIGSAILQFVLGSLSMWAGGYYIFTILFEGRPINWPALFTLFGGGIASAASATRTTPHALISGLALGGTGAYAVYHLGPGFSPMWLGGGILIGMLLFWTVWIITKPYEELLQRLGKTTSWTPLALIIGCVQAVFGIITGLGVVVL